MQDSAKIVNMILRRDRTSWRVESRKEQRPAWLVPENLSRGIVS